MKQSISVVIPTFNSWSTLKLCIESIQKQTTKPNEIIVVDNASTDGTSSKLKKYFKGVKLVTLANNTGVTGGRNMGIKMTRKNSKYIFFFDHDMIAEPTMLEECLKVINSEQKIGIVTPKIYYWTDKKRVWSAGTGMNLWTGQVIFRGGTDMGQFDKDCEVQVAPAAMLVDAKLVKKLKNFDNTYFAVYEDTDYCFRAKELGFLTFYASKAVAYHMLSTDPKDEIDRLLSRAYWVGRNRVIFMKRFGKSFLVFLFFLPVFCSYYLIQSIKNNRFADGLRFLQGTINGVLE